MDATQEKSLNIGYINLRAQTGFGLPKQIQVEQFLKSNKIDILHLQEAQILENTFEMCDFITSNYEITRLSCFNVKTKLLKVKISYFKLSKIILVRLVRLG